MIKKVLLYTGIALAILVLVVCVLRTCHAQTDIPRLKTKADEAKAYCKKHDFDTTFCILIDMKIHSGKNRMFVWDFGKKSIRNSGLCCHGFGGENTGSNPVFSNTVGSNCTSLGKYKIGIRSYSKYGIHIHYKLHGLETTNSNAFKRTVVLHSFDPVPELEIYPLHLPMGFSAGCPVVSNDMMRTLDTLLQNTQKPVLLWIYYE